MARKKIQILVIFFFIIASSIGIVRVDSQKTYADNAEIDLPSSDPQDLFETFSKYIPSEKRDTTVDVDLPWFEQSMNLLEWRIEIEYQGQRFSQQVPIDITDFREKFLKHPEYGEILTFNIDSDPKDDIEIIIGFYWSIIKDASGNDVKSLEKRIRVRQLESGSYVEDPDAEMELWSELHLNYGLFKQEKSKIYITNNLQVWFHSYKSCFHEKGFHNDSTLFLDRIRSMVRTLSDILKEGSEHSQTSSEIEMTAPPADEDYIAVGAGYRSPAGEEIPKYVEKRFGFARDTIFSPTVFQQTMDPGSSKGKGPFELLYGFKSYMAGSTTPSYEIGFSVEFNPAVYLKTKFIPLGGYVYYYFNHDSQRHSETMVTYSAGIERGSGEDITLSLVFDSIDDRLGQSGQWMSFDINMFTDNEPLGGGVHYLASNEFTIDLIVNSPFFEEKIELLQLPQQIDLTWDLDFTLIPTPLLYANAEGFIDLSMSSAIDGINLYYPKTDPADPDQIFIDVPGGIPQSVRIEASSTLQLDVNNFQSPVNHISGSIKHSCDRNIESIRAFLPEQSTPIITISDIPAYSQADATLYWTGLHGNAYVWRGSSGPPDPIEITLSYDQYHIHDILTIRNGYIDTRFKVGLNGHFFFDTSEGMFGNELQVTNPETATALTLLVREVSADKLEADWDLDTSGGQLKINDISFSGMVDTLRDLEMQLEYQGKTTQLGMDWNLGQTGSFAIEIDQDEDVSIDFSEFALNSTDFFLDGGVTLSDTIVFDMEWQLKQGEGTDTGSISPGYFSINKNNAQSMILSFDFMLTYQNRYGISVTFDNLQFYLNCEWWKGGRILPYIWLDYEVSANDFDVDLLWTNTDGETQWYEHVEDW